jgi:pimeloyl-ACP methyl ester carboxylesterase
METTIEIRPGRFVALETYKSDIADCPTVFLIHGLGGRGDQWHEQVKVLKDQYRLVIPHLLGHGNSEKPKPTYSNPYSFYELDQDMEALFNLYKGTRNIVIGHSYGGVLATSLAKNYQHSVERLVLFNPAPCVSQRKIPFVYRLPVFILEALRSLLDRVFQKMAFDESTAADLLEKESLAGKNNKMYVIKAMIQGMKTIRTMDLTKLSVPTCIIFGESDKIFPENVIKEGYQGLPHHTFKTIRHASHMAFLEKPEEVNECLLEFLKQPSAVGSKKLKIV